MANTKKIAETSKVKKASDSKKTSTKKVATKIKNSATKKNVKNNCKCDALLKTETSYPKNIFTQGYNEDLIYTRTWDRVKNPKAVMLILHGMVEHSLRYDYFAKKCNEAGIIVFCFDLRAHGHTVGDPQRVGKYEGDLFGDCVKDAQKFADELIEKYKLPLIIFGHSYGSFLTQELIQNYHKHSLVILSGSACMQGSADVAFGKLIAGITKTFCGKDAPSKFLYKMSFKAYGKPFPNGNWLSSDDAVYDAYNEDPFCGTVCSAQFYSSFFGHLGKLYSVTGLNNIDKDKPILITNGEFDPVAGKNHILADKLDLVYRRTGILSVTQKIWQGCRHEVLNEKNKDEIQKYIIDFIINHLSKVN